MINVLLPYGLFSKFSSLNTMVLVFFELSY